MLHKKFSFKVDQIPQRCITSKRSQQRSQGTLSKVIIAKSSKGSMANLRQYITFSF
jgi:hypothetical protein